MTSRILCTIMNSRLTEVNRKSKADPAQQTRWQEAKCGTGWMNGMHLRFHCRGRCPHRPASSVDSMVWLNGKNAIFSFHFPSPFNTPAGSGGLRADVGIGPYTHVGVRTVQRTSRFRGVAGRCGHRPLHSRRGAYRISDFRFVKMHPGREAARPGIYFSIAVLKFQLIFTEAYLKYTLQCVQ